MENDTARKIFMALEEHNAGWDGIMVNSYWVKIIKKEFGVEDIETLELGKNVKPFETRL
jgi:hypothetical protein